ncbi:MAG: epoxide hydrolase 1 [Actinomycetota bacterium]|nr:epoxide hydrolase 1 [Actinomycetota bacterium]
MADVEPFEICVPDDVLDNLRARLRGTRWPADSEVGWEYGMDRSFLRRLCAHWASEYDWRATERRLNAAVHHRRDGVHFLRAGEGRGLPILLIHGWPGAFLEFEGLVPLLVEAGHEVIVPSLPGYGFSDAPSEPLNVGRVAARLRGLVEEGLGIERYAVQGGDWGTLIAARMAYDSPRRVAAFHVNSPSVLPFPADLSDLTAAEQGWLGGAAKWRTRGAHYMLTQATAPDTLAPGLSDSPAGLAAWLVSKYRDWSDCDGDVERRFTLDQLCDFLTLYWVTETISSSIRLYAAEARDRWKLAPGERIDVPSAVADFPAEIRHPPREWAERTLGDLRSWTEYKRGGHFAAWEEPELLTADLVGFLREVG